jgi:putative intracellular protease/amidase
MFDLATDADSIKLINEFYENDKIISAVCHGPAALVNVKLANGTHLLDGQAVTGLSEAEEDAEEATYAMPFLLETELNKATGGKYEKHGELWGAKTVVSRGGKLITGENPASAKGVGEAIYASIFGHPL